MSLISRARSALRLPLTIGVLVCCASVLTSCAALGGHAQSSVAQGKYYSSGDPRYDEFFIGLYMWQVAMEQAPRTPEVERRQLGQLLLVPPQAQTTESIALRLREEALKLSRAGVRLRLDRGPAREKTEQDKAMLRANARPKDAEPLLAQVEASGTNLQRSVSEMKLGEQALGGLEALAVRLDADVDVAFAQAQFSKQNEVKRNLADAHQIISLMRTRVDQVHDASEELLAAIGKAVDTDDGSLGANGEAAPVTSSEAAKAGGKKPAPKPHPKVPSSAPPVAVAPHPKTAPAAHAKPAAAVESDVPAAPKPAAAKPPPAPRDFEP